MATKPTPTKANLFKAKNRLIFSEKGYNLLDKKRTVLIQEILKLVEASRSLEEKFNRTLQEAYEALQEAIISMGLDHLEHYILSVPKETPYQGLTRSVMGVDIPQLITPKEDNINFSLPYGFNDSVPVLDHAIKKFHEVKFLAYQLAEIETTAFKLSQEIKKTQKSANALEKLKIPETKADIQWIEDSIEEKEREENFRIKKVKKHRQSTK